MFQLSHELTHYVIRQAKSEKETIIKWFEETLCEAMSLYILDLSSKRWKDCRLERTNSEYSQALKTYAKNIYDKSKESILQDCNSLEALRDIERDSEEHREQCAAQRNYLFDIFKRRKNDIKKIVNYTQYLEEDLLTVNFVTWAESRNDYSEFIYALSEIQPIIHEE